MDLLQMPPPPAPVLRRQRRNDLEIEDLQPRNLNLDFMNAVPILPNAHHNVLNVHNVQNVHQNDQAFNVNQLNEYFYNLFQFAKNEQRARGDQTLSWDNYRTRFYNTFLVSEKENIMNDMREEIRLRYDREYPKFFGYSFGKKKSAKKAKKTPKKTKKAKKSLKKAKKSSKKTKSIKKSKKSIRKTKRV